jgi:hypothetical protein
MATLGKGMSHVLGRTEVGSGRFYYHIQNDTQFKTFKLFIFEIFYLVFLGKY